MIKFVSAGLLLLLPFTIMRAGDEDKSPGEFFLYSIGNSHTWDFRPAADFLEIGKALGIDIKNGWHINCGQNLETIWENPEQTCVDLSRFGTYRKAIRKHKWDAISIQTFRGGSGKAEKKAVEEFLSFIAGSVNKDCNVYIYCTWPKNTAEQLGDFNYTEEWLSDFEENDTLEILSGKYFTYLEDAIKKISGRVTFIPLGRVLYRFDQKAKSGEIPGFSGSGELYRDAWHMNNVGRLIAGLTVFAQIFRIDPAGIPDVGSYQASEQWPSDRELTPEQNDIIRNIISEVLEFN